MLDRSWMRRIALAAAAGGIALVLAAAPLAPGAALAKGASNNGVDNSGGKAGGNGNGHGGNGNGNGGSAPGWVIGNSGVGGEDGPGNGHGLALGHDAVSGVGVSANGIHPDNHGALASLLGSLNAAHAIANGNPNANSNSMVGLITAYMDVFNTGTVEEAAADLITASNRDLGSLDTDTVEKVVGGVNDLLGVSVESVESAKSVDDVEDRERKVAEEISPPPSEE